MVKRKKTYSPLVLFRKQYQLNRKKLYHFCNICGTNPNNKALNLKQIHRLFVTKAFNHINLDKYFISKKLNFFWDIKLYRGIRHMLKLPSHGQRTRTNRRTKKKFKF